MRFHVVGLPHTRLLRSYGWCAYTQKVFQFAKMMRSLGHTVYTYAGDEFSDAVAPARPQAHPPSWSMSDPFWTQMEEKVVPKLHAQSERGDFLALITSAQKPIADRSPHLLPVEFGVGYAWTFAPHCVFESYAWMHSVYAGMNPTAFDADGRAYDAVIPNSFDPKDFPEGDGKGGYLLFVGRLESRKGLAIAVETARRARLPLKIAGEGSLRGFGAARGRVEYLGLVGPSKRAKLMGGAIALLAPTSYIGPFEGVAVEAQMTGTPVITTDWGAFVETVEQGVTGYRCRDFGEFSWAAKHAGELNRGPIRNRALRVYSTAQVRYDYQTYFHRLRGLFDGHDFYGAEERRPGRDRLRKALPDEEAS